MTQRFYVEASIEEDEASPEYPTLYSRYVSAKVINLDDCREGFDSLGMILCEDPNDPYIRECLTECVRLASKRAGLSC